MASISTSAIAACIKNLRDNGIFADISLSSLDPLDWPDSVTVKPEELEKNARPFLIAFDVTANGDAVRAKEQDVINAKHRTDQELDVVAVVRAAISLQGGVVPSSDDVKTAVKAQIDLIKPPLA